jgi:hypothetical protein
MTITKRSDGRFEVKTGDITSDMREIAATCALVGHELRTTCNRGEIALTPLRVKLGSISFARVNGMLAGETVIL